MTNAGVTLDPVVKGIYDTALAVTEKREVSGWGGTTIKDVQVYIPNTSAGDFTQDGYQVSEFPLEKFTDPAAGNGPTDWRSGQSEQQ